MEIEFVKVENIEVEINFGDRSEKMDLRAFLSAVFRNRAFQSLEGAMVGFRMSCAMDILDCGSEPAFQFRASDRDFVLQSMKDKDFQFPVVPALRVMPFVVALTEALVVL